MGNAIVKAILDELPDDLTLCELAFIIAGNAILLELVKTWRKINI